MKSVSLKYAARLMQCFTTSDQPFTSVAVDSRLVTPGALFFCLPGLKTDGHNYLKAAIANGAVAAVIHSSYHTKHPEITLIRSDNVLNALQVLAKNVLNESNITIVAVTGSVGKTTTKEFIKTLLTEKYTVSASSGNSNSQIGLPLTILNDINLADDILIVEMGMTEKGHIAKLIEIAPPHVAVITQISLVHALYFSGVEEIAKAKAELFQSSRTKLCIYHKESDFDHILSETAKGVKLSYSMEDKEADLFLQRHQECMSIIIKDNSLKPFSLPLIKIPGTHNYQNYLAAIAVALYFKLDHKEILKAQANLFLPLKRLQIVEKNEAIFVNDAYNACEISMVAALRSLPPVRFQGKHKAVFGAMMELGQFSEQCHRRVALCALDYVEEIYCYGQECLPILEYWNKLGKFIVWAEERQGIIEALKTNLRPGDVVLLKGSRSTECWRVIDDLFPT